MPITNNFKNRYVEDPDELYLSESASGFFLYDSTTPAENESAPVELENENKRPSVFWLKNVRQFIQQVKNSEFLQNYRLKL